MRFLFQGNLQKKEASPHPRVWEKHTETQQICIVPETRDELTADFFSPNDSQSCYYQDRLNVPDETPSHRAQNQTQGWTTCPSENLWLSFLWSVFFVFWRCISPSVVTQWTYVGFYCVSPECFTTVCVRFSHVMMLSPFFMFLGKFPGSLALWIPPVEQLTSSLALC